MKFDEDCFGEENEKKTHWETDDLSDLDHFFQKDVIL